MTSILLWMSISVSAALMLVAMAVYSQAKKRRSLVEKEVDRVLDEGRRHAKRLLEVARDKGLEIMAAAEIDADKDGKRIRNSLENISANNLRELNEVLDNVSRDIKSAASSEVVQFRQAMQLQVMEMQKELAKELDEGKYKADMELVEYKKRELARIDAEIYEVLRRVVREVVGKVIPVEEHMKLVNQALEEAKKDV